MSKRKKTVLCLLLVITIIIVLGWRKYDFQSELNLRKEVAVRLPQPGSRQMAPGFTLFDLEGEKVELSDFKGSVVLLGFWTTW